MSMKMQLSQAARLADQLAKLAADGESVDLQGEAKRLQSESFPDLQPETMALLGLAMKDPRTQANELRRRATLLRGLADANLDIKTVQSRLSTGLEFLGQTNVGTSGSSVDQTLARLGVPMMAGVDAGVNVDVDVELEGLRLQRLEALLDAHYLGPDLQIRTEGNRVVFQRGEGITDAQFKAAIDAALGDNVQIKNGQMSFELTKGQSPKFDTAFDFAAAWKNTTVDGNGKLALKDGKLSAAVEANLTHVFGPRLRLEGQHRLVYDDTGFSADLREKLSANLGPQSKDGLFRTRLDTTFDVGVEQGRLQRLGALVDFHHASKDGRLQVTSTGNQVTFKRGEGVTDAQFRALVQGAVGKHVQINNGQVEVRFDPKREHPLSFEAASKFAAMFDKTELTGQGGVRFKDGAVSAELDATLKHEFGPRLSTQTDGRLTYDDSGLSGTIRQALTANLGAPRADGLFQTRIGAQVDVAVEQGRLQRMEALVNFHHASKNGRLQINSTGNRVVFQRGRGVTDAEFKAAIEAAIGDSVQIKNGQVAFELREGQSPKFNAAADFAAAFQNTRVDGKGHLALKDGRLSGAVEANLTHVFGPRLRLEGQHRLVYDDTGLNANLREKLSANLGPQSKDGLFRTRLDSTLDVAVEQGRLQRLGALVDFHHASKDGRLQVTSTGNQVTFKRGEGVTDAQFRALVQGAVGKHVQIDNGQVEVRFDPKREHPLSFEAASKFAAVFDKTELTGQGGVRLKDGAVSAELDATLKHEFGPRLSTQTDGRLTYDDSGLSGTIRQALTANLGAPRADGLFQTRIGAQVDIGIEQSRLTKVEALFDVQTALKDGKLTVSSEGNRVRFKRGEGITEAEFHALVKGALGDGVQLERGQVDVVLRPQDKEYQAAVDFAVTTENTRLDAQGNLRVKEGRLNGDLRASLERTFGPNLSIEGDYRVVYKDGQLSGQVRQGLEAQLGNTKLEGLFESKISAKGIENARVFAAASRASEGVRVSGQGVLEVVDNRVDEVKAALEILAEENGVKLESRTDGTFSFSPPGVTTAQLTQKLRYASQRVTADVNGRLHVDSEGLRQAELKAVFDLFGAGGKPLNIHGDLQLSFDDEGFALDVNQLEAQYRLGNTQLSANLSTRISEEGIEEASVFAAAKRVVGSTTQIGEVRFQVEDGQLKEAQAALELLAEKNGVKLVAEGNGIFRFEDGKFKAADVAGRFGATLERSSVDVNGNLTFNGDGLERAEATAMLQHTFGDRAGFELNASGRGKVVLDDEGLRIEELQAQLEGKIGDVNLDANLVYDEGLKGSLSLAAVKRLQAMKSRGDFQVQPDGRIDFDGKSITRAELGALFTAVSGETVNIDGNGRLVYENGQWAGELQSQAKVLLDETELDADLNLRLRDGRLSGALEGALTQTVGSVEVKAGGRLDFEGLDLQSGRLDLAANGIGGKISASGSLEFEPGRLRARVSAGFDLDAAKLMADGSFRIEDTARTEGNRVVHEYVRAKDGGLEVMVPLGLVNVGGKGRIGRNEQISISVPERQKEALDGRMDDLLTGLKDRNVDDLIKNGGLPSLRLERTFAKQDLGGLKVGLTAPIGAVASVTAGFGGSIQKDDVVGYRVDFDRRDPNRADVRMWKVNMKEVMRELSIRINPTPIQADVIAGVLRDHLTTGSDVVNALVGAGLGPIAQQVSSFVQDANISFTSRNSKMKYGASTVEFAGFDLSRTKDADAFRALIEDGDPRLAIQGGKFLSSETRTENQRKAERALNLFGLKLFVDDTVDVRSLDRQWNVGGQTVRLSANAAQVQRLSGRLFEKNSFVHQVVTAQVDDAVEAASIIHMKSEDKAVREKEIDQVMNAAEAVGLKMIRNDRKKQGWIDFDGYGKGTMNLSVSVTERGLLKMLKKDPLDAQRSATEVAARVQGRPMPVSEQTDGLTHPAAKNIKVDFASMRSLFGRNIRRREFPNVPKQFGHLNPGSDPALSFILGQQDFTVMTRRDLGKAKERIRDPKWLKDKYSKNLPESRIDQVAKTFQSIPDKELDILLRRAAASRFLLETWDKRSGFPDDNHNMHRDMNNYRRMVKEMTGKNGHADDDLFAVLQGMGVRDVFHRPSIETLRNDIDGLQPGELRPVIKDLFENVIPEVLPSSSLFGGNGTKATLSFYGGLLDGLDSEEAIVVARVKAKDADVLAVTPGVDSRLVDEVEKQPLHSMEDTIEKVLQEAELSNQNES